MRTASHLPFCATWHSPWHSRMYRAHTENLWILSGTFYQGWVQLSVMQLTFRCHIGARSPVCYLTKAQQQKGEFNPKLLRQVQPKHLFKPLDAAGMLTMAGNHDNHFSAAVVTEAHWKKPSNVSSFLRWRTSLTFSSIFSVGLIAPTLDHRYWFSTCQQSFFMRFSCSNKSLVLFDV